MSSTAPYRVVVHLSIIFGCVLVCQGGILDFGQHKHEGDIAYESNTPLHQDQAIIEFPALDEMTSAERVANRQRARKVATIIEKSIHMLADDILQMWAIAHTEKAERDDSDVAGDADAEQETESESTHSINSDGDTRTETTEGANAKTSEVALGEELEGAVAKIIDRVGTEAIARVDVESSGRAGAGTEGAEAKTSEGTEASVDHEVAGIKATEEAETKTTEVVGTDITQSKESSPENPENVRSSDLTQNSAIPLKETSILRFEVDHPGTYIKSKSAKVLTI